MMAPLPRIAAPCTEDLDAMARTERGSFCDKCRHEVVDLRRAPKKKALAVLAELRRASPTGRVCVRTIARPDGTPVFGADPPGAFARYAAPIALATSLAACTPASHAPIAAGSTPVAIVHPPAPAPTNQNGSHRPVAAITAPASPPTPQPATLVVVPPEIEMAGEMVWDGP
jgi:hypothetical protein